MYKRKIIYIAEGKDSAVLKEFANFIREHNADPEQIIDLSMDMSKAFIKGANDQFPQASITFDPFHLMKNMNDAVNKTRIAEQKEQVILKGKQVVVLKDGEISLTDNYKDLTQLFKNGISGQHILKLSQLFRSLSRLKTTMMKYSKIKVD